MTSHATDIHQPISQKKRKLSSTDDLPSSSSTKKRKTKSSLKKSLTNKKVNRFTGLAFSDRFGTLLKQRRKLPVWKAVDKLDELVQENQITLLVGATGSGKTTQVPQALVHAGYTDDGKLIACTQPRRVAAINVATRVSQEMDVRLGGPVGYTIRFEDKTDGTTRLKYLTDGMLLREAILDPMLSKYSVVIIDEAHERTLATDILMGLLKEILPKRPDLKVIVMSATLDAGKFQEYFEEAPVLKIPGRTYPVEILYTAKPEQDYLEAAIRTVIRIHLYEDPGDILLFLTGEEEIVNACQEIMWRVKDLGAEAGPVQVFPLYSALDQRFQMRVFDPVSEGTRKIVISTNIAETSVTIDGVVYVVDPGFVKQKVYNPRIRVESLLVSPISQASANQRAGRAGRTRPGKCFRLYTERSFHKELKEHTYPEILRTSLSTVVLTLKKLNVPNIVTFDFMDPPAPETMMRALEQLRFLGALDTEGELTELGSKMAMLPLDPQLAKLLIVSPEFKCSEEIATLAAILSAPPLLQRPQKNKEDADEAHAQFASSDGDHLTLLNVWYAYQTHAVEDPKQWCKDNYVSHRGMSQVERIRQQMISLMRNLDIPIVSHNYSSREYSISIRKCVAAAFFMQVAYCNRNHYLTIKDEQEVDIHPSCSLNHKAEWVVFHEFVMTSKNWIRNVTKVEGDWLLELAPEYYNLAYFKDSVLKTALKQVEMKVANKKNKQKKRW
eukprot:CAMPEP_0117441260 /NCGR_PEP_ID=MMETSP0759-20121206/3544_1 /TAXON_ID=63605 /ORGANISM="Percolomonas cosmopolitus, Strain WS" /LENGTH=724 /DNA_ID=CAMNT_0005233111 /DNA_START=343 /DNA_END=2517 /DNA_ORIENTATION=+